MPHDGRTKKTWDPTGGSHVTQAKREVRYASLILARPALRMTEEMPLERPEAEWYIWLLATDWPFGEVSTK